MEELWCSRSARLVEAQEVHVRLVGAPLSFRSGGTNPSLRSRGTAGGATRDSESRAGVNGRKSGVSSLSGKAPDCESDRCWFESSLTPHAENGGMENRSIDGPVVYTGARMTCNHLEGVRIPPGPHFGRRARCWRSVRHPLPGRSLKGERQSYKLCRAQVRILPPRATHENCARGGRRWWWLPV